MADRQRTRTRPDKTTPLRFLAFYGIGFLLAVLATNSVFGGILDDQRLTVIFCRWTPSARALTFEDLRANPMLADEDVKLLRRAGVRGHLEVTGAGIHGSGVPAKAIVLLSAPLDKPVTLKQPQATSVAYIQEKDGFTAYPEDTPFIERRIELRPDWARGPIVYYAVELVSGARQGGSAVFWREDRRPRMSPNMALEPSARN